MAYLEHYQAIRGPYTKDGYSSSTAWSSDLKNPSRNCLRTGLTWSNLQTHQTCKHTDAYLFGYPDVPVECTYPITRGQLKSRTLPMRHSCLAGSKICRMGQAESWCSQKSVPTPKNRVSGGVKQAGDKQAMSQLLSNINCVNVGAVLARV